MRKQTLVLLGGTYGAGKSTTAVRFNDSFRDRGYNSAVVDYDILIGNSSGKAVDPVAAEVLREWAWKEGFINAINDELGKGREVVFAAGTFTKRVDRRDMFINALDSRGLNLVPIFFMLPMRKTIAAIRATRDETHLVNGKSFAGFYGKQKKTFPYDDNTDLLLPSVRELLPPEYRAMLSRTDENRQVLTTPHLDSSRPHRWVVATDYLDPAIMLHVVREGITKPCEVRSAVEGQHSFREAMAAGREAFAMPPVGMRAVAWAYRR